MFLPAAINAKNFALSAGGTALLVPIVEKDYHFTLFAQYAADILPLAMFAA